VILLTGDSPPRHRVTTATLDQPEVSAAPTIMPLACGNALPFELRVPSGYDGPFSGVAPGAPPAESGQLVDYWQSTTGSFERRWPAAAEFDRMWIGTDQRPPGSGVIGAMAFSSRTEPDGRTSQTILVHVLDQVVSCQVVQLTIYDPDPGRVDATLAEMLAEGVIVSHIPLVTETTNADALPPAQPCQTPPGVTSPNQGGAVDGGAAYPTARDALQAFVAQPETAPRLGYSEVNLPDGSVGYVYKVRDNDDFVSIVIHVRHDLDGWRVDSWDASGC
jgi:hypothetical protein